MVTDTQRSAADWNSDPLPAEVVVWGAKGHSLMILQGIEPQWHGRVRVRAFVDEFAPGEVQEVVKAPIISAEERRSAYGDIPVLLGLNSPAARLRVYRRLQAEGAVFAGGYGGAESLVHPAATFGAGCIVGDYVRIGATNEFGPACQIFATMVAHDVTVGAGTTVGVYSSVLGNVEIGSEVNIAPHAVICNGYEGRRLTIGDGATVGVGAVVTRDVPPGAAVVGNPAMSVDEWRRVRRTTRSSPDDS